MASSRKKLSKAKAAKVNDFSSYFEPVMPVAGVGALIGLIGGGLGGTIASMLLIPATASVGVAFAAGIFAMVLGALTGGVGLGLVCLLITGAVCLGVALYNDKSDKEPSLKSKLTEQNKKGVDHDDNDASPVVEPVKAELAKKDKAEPSVATSRHALYPPDTNNTIHSLSDVPFTLNPIYKPRH